MRRPCGEDGRPAPGEEHKLDPNRNGWDHLLLQWYRKKSSAERSRVQGEHREKRTESVATTAERIFVRYALERELVGLKVPCIRLPEVGERRPLLQVLQSGTIIWQNELQVTGNDLCLTTKSRFLPLRETDFDFNAPPSLRAKITYMDKEIYDSSQKLERDYLIFDSFSSDRTVKSGRAFLFAGTDVSVEFSQEDGVLHLPHPGQLYRLDLTETASVAVDGQEVFAGAEASAQFRRHTVPRCVRGLRGLDGGGLLELFREPFALFLALPEGENPLLYRLSLDGESRSLKEFQGADGTLTIPSVPEENLVHSVKMVDIRTGLIRYEYRYAILPGCAFRLDKSLYRSGVDEVEAVLSWDGRETRLTLPVPEEDALSFSLPGLDFTLELDIPAGEFVRIRPPEGWSCRLLLGDHEIPCPDGTHFELGNELRASRAFRETEPLGLLLSKGQERFQYRLGSVDIMAPTTRAK